MATTWGRGELETLVWTDVERCDDCGNKRVVREYQQPPARLCAACDGDRRDVLGQAIKMVSEDLARLRGSRRATA